MQKIATISLLSTIKENTKNNLCKNDEDSLETMGSLFFLYFK